MDYEKFVTICIPLEDNWESNYKKVIPGYALFTDVYGGGYFFEYSEMDWIIINDYKPTGKVIAKSEDKEFIVKCMEAKKADIEEEFLQEKRRYE